MLLLSFQVVISVAVCLSKYEIKDTLIKHQPEKVDGGHTICIRKDSSSGYESWRTGLRSIARLC